MKYTSILFFLLLLAVHYSYAAPAEAEYGKYQESWTLQTDNSQEYRCYQELTLFTHTAMNSTYGETFITYNPRYQELVIHSSYTRQKDGSIVRTPKNAFVEVLPRRADNAPAYNHLKEMVIVHTGLELGATIVLDYSIISRPGYLPAIDVCQRLQKSSPIKEYTLTFNVPDDKSVYYKLQGSSVQPSQSEQDHQQQYQWKLNNLPAASREPGISLLDKKIPAFIFNTYTSSTEALQILYNRLDLSSTVSNLAGEITKDCHTPTAKLRAIHTYVINHLDDCPLGLSETGYTLRPVSDILQSGYATEIEKANLLWLLLKAAKIPSILAAVYDQDCPPEHCGLNGIHKFAILPQVDKHSYRLSVHSPKPIISDYAFLIDIGNAQVIEPDTLPATIDYQAGIYWKENKAEAKVQALFSNGFISNSSGFAEELVQLNGKTEVNQQQSTTNIQGECPVNITQHQDYLLLNLPETKQGITQQYNYARYNSKRQNTLFLLTCINENYSYSIELPDDLTLCTPIKEKQIRNTVGDLLISINQEGNKIKVQRSLSLRKSQITPSDYPAFRALMTEWDDSNQQQLLLKHNK